MDLYWAKCNMRNAYNWVIFISSLRSTVGIPHSLKLMIMNEESFMLPYHTLAEKEISKVAISPEFFFCWAYDLEKASSLTNELQCK